MNAPPEANTEYSRGSGTSRTASGTSQTGSAASQRPIPRGRQGADAGSSERERPSRAAAAIALLAVLGALLIIVAQFTSLYRVRAATGTVGVKTVETGANHAWAPIPLALLAIVLAFAAWRYGSRAALAGLVVLGIVTLLIALLGDLPNARGSGLIGSSAGGYVQASSTPSAGLYMETLGAVLLVIAGGLGLLMVAAPDAGPPSPEEPLSLQAAEGGHWSAS